MKKFIQFLLAFALTAIIGSILIEGIKIYVAYEQGYEAEFHEGMYFFSNPSINAKAKALKDSDLSFEEVEKTEEWKRLRGEYEKDMAYIEASGMLLSIALAFIGLIMLRRKSSRKEPLKLSHWLGFFTSLIFVRYLVRHTIGLVYFVDCREFAFFQFLGFESMKIIYVLYALGLALALFILFQVPKKHILSLLIAGAIGGFLGLLLWMKWLGPLLG